MRQTATLGRDDGRGHPAVGGADRVPVQRLRRAARRAGFSVQIGFFYMFRRSAKFLGNLILLGKTWGK